MTNDLNFSNFVAVIALIVSAISALKSNSATKRANSLAKVQAEIAKGQAEIEIRNMILTAKYHYSDMCVHLNEDPESKLLQQRVLAALEDVANAYDEACTKYLDGKIDKERFMKTYSIELRKWVEDENIKDKYVMPHTQFKATVKVYNQWNDLEK